MDSLFLDQRNWIPSVGEGFDKVGGVEVVGWLICRPDVANQLSEVSAALSALPFCLLYAFPGLPDYVTPIHNKGHKKKL